MVQVIMQRLCCGATQKAKHYYRPLFLLGSLEGEALKAALEERLEGVFADATAGTSYYHNVWSEAHMPAYVAVCKGSARTMQDVYAMHLQPEKQPLRDLCVYHAGPMRFRELITSALSQRSDCKGDNLVITKLIEKCCFGSMTGQAESVRYIRAQFAKAYQNDVDSFAGLVAACLHLGTVPGGPIATPATRIAFHLDRGGAIDQMLGTLPSRILWASLIYAITSMCDTDPIFRRLRRFYYGLDIFEPAVDAAERRQVVVEKAVPALQGVAPIDGSRSRKRGRPREVRNPEDALASYGQQKRRLTETLVRSTFKGSDPKKQLAPVYRTILRSAPRHPRPDEQLLDSLALNTPTGRQFYRHAIEQRRTLTVTPRSALLQQHSDLPIVNTVKVCLGCYTLRSRPRGCPANKATESTIRLRNGGEMCAACLGTRIVEFDSNKFIISSLNKHTDARCVVSQACSSCGFPSVISTVRGIHPLCASCDKEKKRELKMRCSICERVLSKRSYYMHILKKNTVGHATQGAVCSSCQNLGPKETAEPWDLEPLKKLQAGRHQRLGLILRKNGRRRGTIAGLRM